MRPGHVRALLGERMPDDRERYDLLTRDLERHRIEHGVNVGRDGPLGGLPRGRESSDDYAKSRIALTERVVAHRQDRGLDVFQFERGGDIGLDRHGFQ